MTPIRYTMAEAMSAVERRIEDFGRAASFRDLVADCDERIQVVVRFLALLELYRDGRVEQEGWRVAPSAKAVQRTAVAKRGRVVGAGVSDGAPVAAPRWTSPR